jgi:hypothetical protein
MFNPSRDDVRRFFCEAWRKRRAGELVSPLEAIALHWIDQHPEYHALLDDEQGALNADFSIDRAQANPFLHLSMHLAIAEQLSIDQPPGVAAAFARLAARTDGEHGAAHEAMECLGRVLWETQRGLSAPDPQTIGAAYLDCLMRRATR